MAVQFEQPPNGAVPMDTMSLVKSKIGEDLLMMLRDSIREDMERSGYKWKPDDEYAAYPFWFQGTQYTRTAWNGMYTFIDTDTLGSWVGMYEPNLRRIDTTAAEPEYED